MGFHLFKFSDLKFLLRFKLFLKVVSNLWHMQGCYYSIPQSRLIYASIRQLFEVVHLPHPIPFDEQKSSELSFFLTLTQTHTHFACFCMHVCMYKDDLFALSQRDKDEIQQKRWKGGERGLPKLELVRSPMTQRSASNTQGQPIFVHRHGSISSTFHMQHLCQEIYAAFLVQKQSLWLSSWTHFMLKVMNEVGH